MLADLSKERFDVIIQAGQSNAEGCSYGTARSPYEPKDRVWYLNEDMTLSVAREAVCGNEIRTNFSLAFADRYLENGCLEDGCRLLILRAAVGATGFSDHRWRPQDDLFLRMTDMIRTAMELNPENRIRALLWHQGETDAGNHMSKEEYRQNLETLVTLVRKQTGCEDLPFVAGDFVQDWKGENLAVCEPVISAIKELCSDLKAAAFVSSDALPSNRQDHFCGYPGDGIHFCRESSYELGRRYFDAYLSCLA